MRKWLLWNKKYAVFCTQILQYYSSKQKYTSLRLCSIDRMYKIFKVSLQNYQWAASASISRSRRRTIERCTDGHRQNVQGLCAHVIPFPIPVRSRLLIYGVYKVCAQPVKSTSLWNLSLCKKYVITLPVY